MTAKGIAELIAVTRKSKRWSQRELARRAGIHRLNVYHIESGVIDICNTGFGNVVAISDALEIDLKDFADSVRFGWNALPPSSTLTDETTAKTSITE